MGLEVGIADNFADVVEDWWRLLEAVATKNNGQPKSPFNQIFITPTFQQTWWEILGQGRLHLITFRQQQTHELIGIAPFFIQNQILKLVGCKAVSDYLDIIFNPELTNEVYSLLANSVIRLIIDKKIGAVELCSLPHQSQTLILLPSLIKQKLPSAKITINQQDVCPIIQLPETIDQYLALLERKQRHEIKRKLRKLESEADFFISCVTQPTKISSAIQEFVRLHQLSSPNKHDFWTDEHLQFFTALLPKMAEKGWLKLYFLYLKNWRANSLRLAITAKPVATMLIFDYRDTFSLYNSGYDPLYQRLSVGQILTTQTIAEAIRLKKLTYDFLRGGEEYKLRLGGTPQPVYDLIINN